MRTLLKLLVGMLFVLSPISANAQQGHPPPRLPEPHMSADGPSPALRLPKEGARTDSTHWSDTLDGDWGLSAAHSTVAVGGDLILTQIVPLPYPEEGGAILAAVSAPNGKIYLGTSGAYLNVYDPATGIMTSLGAPVPDECFT
jgi:hypothetical protein